MRFKQCTLKSGEEKRQAYVKEADAYVGNVITLKDDQIWKVIEVGVFSVSADKIKYLNNVDKKDYGV